MTRATTETVRPVRIVIHGVGGSFLETLDRVGDGFRIRLLSWRDALFVPQREVTVFRHLMQAPNDNPHTRAVRMLLASRVCTAAPVRERPPAEAYAALSRSSVEHAFCEFGLPVTPVARGRRAARLAAEADAALQPLRAALGTAAQSLRDAGRLVPEHRARELLVGPLMAAGIPADEGIRFLEMLRDQHETGGDLDTVASATLHAYAELQAARSVGRTLAYGRDYCFVFVNYHQSFRFLEAFAPADVLAADLPIEAFPSLVGDARWLAAREVRLRRFEDHHPYTPAARDALLALQREGVLEVVDLSGPLKGEELPPGTGRCAADMVFDNRIAGTAWENAAARRLKALAHAEDLVTERIPEGQALTTLIKGGACKVEMAQRLLEGLLADDLDNAFTAADWMPRAAAIRAELDAATASLSETVALLRVATEADAAPRRVLVALAPPPAPDQPRIPVGRAVEYYGAAYPDTDYVFYCWGASLLVARRLNQNDTLLNLGDLMGRIGTPSDGGHGGAAVCRPELNAQYPHRLLGRITPATFQPFVRYLAQRLEADGWSVDYETLTRRSAHDRMTHAGRRLAAILLAALLLGWGLVLFAPAFRREAVAASNDGFMEYLADEGMEPDHSHAEAFP